MVNKNIHPFEIGKFVADTMLHGILHPDMHLNNLGFRDNGQIVFTDYAESEKIDIPNDLDAENIRRLTGSLFPLVDDIGSFSDISYFRAGYVSRCGFLGRTLFSNTCNNGFSSLGFLNDTPVDIAFVVPELKDSIIIKEWTHLDTKFVSPIEYATLEDYSRSPERRNISPFNMYFVDYLYFIRSYLMLSSLEGDREGLNNNITALILNMAKSAFSFHLPVTAYGLYLKAENMNSTMPGVNKICIDGINEARDMGNPGNSMKEFMESCVNLDLIELLWVLDDLDRIVSKDASLHRITEK